MHLSTENGLRFTAEFTGKKELKVTQKDLEVTGFILADSGWDLEIQVGIYKDLDRAVAPPVLFELYVDGVLRNVASPRTGRGLAYKQVAELTIDRGVIASDKGELQMQKFRFLDLDIDDAILTSRVVKDAGNIRIDVVHEKLASDIRRKDKLELPRGEHDHGAVTVFEGEINNTIGVRFDQKKGGLADNKYIKLEAAANVMFSKAQQDGRKLLASFKFIYGDKDLLNHLEAFPVDHKHFDQDLQWRRDLPLGTCFSYKPGRGLVDISCIPKVAKSDYSTLSVVDEHEQGDEDFENESDLDKENHMTPKIGGIPDSILTPPKSIKRRGILADITPINDDSPAGPLVVKTWQEQDPFLNE